MSVLRTPLRQRAWHSPIIEDAAGHSVATATTVPVAQTLIACSNAHDALVRSLEELLPIASRTVGGTTDGEPVLARARQALADARAAAQSLG